LTQQNLGKYCSNPHVLLKYEIIDALLSLYSPE